MGEEENMVWDRVGWDAVIRWVGGVRRGERECVGGWGAYAGVGESAWVGGVRRVERAWVGGWGAYAGPREHAWVVGAGPPTLA